MTISPLPKLRSFPQNLPLEGAVRIELVEGIPIFRSTTIVQARIETLLAKQQDETLSLAEEEELDCYEEIDDYLSFVNRTMQNISFSSTSYLLESPANAARLERSISQYRAGKAVDRDLIEDNSAKIEIAKPIAKDRA